MKETGRKVSRPSNSPSKRRNSRTPVFDRLRLFSTKGRSLGPATFSAADFARPEIFRRVVYAGGYLSSSKRQRAGEKYVGKMAELKEAGAQCAEFLRKNKLIWKPRCRFSILGKKRAAFNQRRAAPGQISENSKSAKRSSNR